MSGPTDPAFFIRQAMLLPQAPPASQRGAAKWLRENLFSGPVNTALTILALATLYYLISLALPWLLHSVWNADSLAECRTKIAASFGPDAGGACWAVIRARWYQFIFGFYPPALYWRPALTFGLLFVALTPILFSDNPRSASRMTGIVAILTIACLALTQCPLWLFAGLSALMTGLYLMSIDRPTRLLSLTLLYPFITVWLLWGGSVWGPVLAFAGFGDRKSVV